MSSLEATVLTNLYETSLDPLLWSDTWVMWGLKLGVHTGISIKFCVNLRGYSFNPVFMKLHDHSYSLIL